MRSAFSLSVERFDYNLIWVAGLNLEFGPLGSQLRLSSVEWWGKDAVWLVGAEDFGFGAREIERSEWF
ncbi:hypothetical protein JRO89_XSUnG0211000 [Xanthoceras sorbifolium]|uniref:Uncharacterized protein n=1 Tax=Xanthoceras sorbifolium TaxID=99658 RepID=A0ABQ8GZ65_9ROSI|nr:hypothetical protein JRO89_XSUnG0211000 [Xanthoceras sorbifolium]